MLEDRAEANAFSSVHGKGLNSNDVGLVVVCEDVGVEDGLSDPGSVGLGG